MPTHISESSQIMISMIIKRKCSSTCSELILYFAKMLRLRTNPMMGHGEAARERVNFYIVAFHLQILLIFSFIFLQFLQYSHFAPSLFGKFFDLCAEVCWATCVEMEHIFIPQFRIPWNHTCAMCSQHTVEVVPDIGGVWMIVFLHWNYYKNTWNNKDKSTLLLRRW